MDPQEPFRRYVEAGMALGQLTQAKAEALVRELLQLGDDRATEVQDRLGELVERTRRDLEAMRTMVRREISAQLRTLDVVTKQDLEALESRLRGATPAAPPSGPAPQDDVA